MINFKQVKKYCKEDISKIKNYEQAIADKTQTWVCHHMTETWWNCSRKELIENECYYNRKACELIFLTPADHKSLHFKGKSLSEESKQKMSVARKGKTYHKGKTHSADSRRKMSEAHKGKTTSIFGKSFKEHYGITHNDDKKLYKKEYSFYLRHGKFSWK